MIKYIRKLLGPSTVDPSSIDAIEYSNPAGSQKVSEVGRSLLPLGDGAGGYTTDASTLRVLPNPGVNLAVYNKDTAVHAITFGYNNTLTAQAVGAVDANGNAGIACPPGQWTYVSSSGKQWVITDNANLVVYLIEDSTYIGVEATQ